MVESSYIRVDHFEVLLIRFFVSLEQFDFEVFAITYLVSIVRDFLIGDNTKANVESSSLWFLNKQDTNKTW